MPAAIAHRVFAEKALAGVPCPDLAYLGAQGPDPFMGYGLVPYRKRADKSAVQPFGSKMHGEHLAPIYSRLVAYAAKKEGEEKEKLFSYLYGLLSHYALDRALHPYIFYRTGFDENGKYGGIYVFYHGYFEAILDRAIAEAAALPPASYRVLPKLAPEDLALVSAMWAEASGLPEGAFAESYRDFKEEIRLIHSRTGFKRWLLKLFMGKESKAYSLSLPPSLKKFTVLDVLNERHEEWKDPTSGEASRLSVGELFAEAEKALPKARRILKIGAKGEDVSALFDEWEDGVDHDGGRFGEKKRHCDICFLRHPETL